LFILNVLLYLSVNSVYSYLNILESNNLKIKNNSFTLVDQVEEKLREYFKEQELMPGDRIPREVELAESLGVARSVLREALSRLRMLGLIDSRSRRGMVLTEPDLLGGFERVVDPRILSRKKVLEILELRIMIEIGIADFIFNNVTDNDIRELEKIVNKHTVFENNVFLPEDDYEFHAKLFEISKNKTVVQFQKIIRPVYEFIRENFKDFFDPFIKTTSRDELVSHKHLFELIKAGELDEYRKAMRKHLELYIHFIQSSESD